MYRRNTRTREQRDTGAQGGARGCARAGGWDVHRSSHRSRVRRLVGRSRVSPTPRAGSRSPDARLHTHYCQSECHRAGRGGDARVTRRSGQRSRPEHRTRLRCADRPVESRPESVCDCDGAVWTDGSGSGAAGRAPPADGRRGKANKGKSPKSNPAQSRVNKKRMEWRSASACMR